MSPQLLLELEAERKMSPSPLSREKMEYSPLVSKQVLQGFSPERTKALEHGLSSFFQGQQEETRLTQARRILGSSVMNLSDQDLEVKITEFQYLIERWMDAFERSIFNNQTLTQVVKGE